MFFFLVNTENVEEDDRWSHPRESLSKLVDVADSVDVKGIAGLKAIINQQRRHRA